MNKFVNRFQFDSEHFKSLTFSQKNFFRVVEAIIRIYFRFRFN